MYKQEKRVLRLITIIPILIVIVFFLLILFIVVNNQIKQGNQAIEDIRKNYIISKKNSTKNEVLTLVGHIKYERNAAEKNLKKELKQRVDEAYAISMNIYLQNKTKNKKIITKLIKDALRPIRFNQGRGYFFIYSMNLKNILLPIAPNLEGKDFSNYQDVKGDFVVKNAAKICKKNGNTFYTWYWRKPRGKLSDYKKIGYDRYFEPLDWFIGTGEYVADFNKNLQQNLLAEIQKTRYGKNGYFFTYSYDGTVLTHVQKSLIGVNRINLQDMNGNYIVKDIIKKAKNGGGFLKYIATVNPSTGKKAKKISYIAGINGWHWAIGAGEYLGDIEKVIKKKQEALKIALNSTLSKLSIVFALIAVLLAILLLVITSKSKNLFHQYKNTILEETKKSRKQLLVIHHQKKLASMGEMLGNISHQWKQPLNTLGISIGKIILLEDSGKLTKEVMLKSFDRMERNIEYLSKTIDVFRDFFKPSNNIERFYLKKEIKNVIYIIQDSFEDSLIDLEYTCKENLSIEGDKKKLEQVFLNILSNAKDAIIINDIKKPKVKIEATVIDDKVIITIQDNAQGIPLEIKDKIFEPYFTTKLQYNGTGVGLYMSKIIVENDFQGDLKFENTNDGTKFIIIIPIDDGTINNLI